LRQGSRTGWKWRAIGLLGLLRNLYFGRFWGECQVFYEELVLLYLAVGLGAMFFETDHGWQAEFTSKNIAPSPTA